MKSKDLLIIAAIVGVGYFFLAKTALNPAQKRAALVQYANEDNLKKLFSTTMTDNEINAVYSFIFDYRSKGKQVVPGSLLAQQIQAIATKYNIFT